jgi:hypothetical protein
MGKSLSFFRLVFRAAATCGWGHQGVVRWQYEMSVPLFRRLKSSPLIQSQSKIESQYPWEMK